jgi:N-acyl-D-aspartate/D-glutamate deacylase
MLYAASLLTLLAAGNPAAPVEADLVLRGATVYDGSGQPGRVGDVALKGDRVVAVGQFEVAGQPRVLDCTGLVVAPGFIDLHTHSDGPILRTATRYWQLRLRTDRRRRLLQEDRRRRRRQ